MRYGSVSWSTVEAPSFAHTDDRKSLWRLSAIQEVVFPPVSLLLHDVHGRFAAWPGLMLDPPASSQGSPQEEATERARLREEQEAEYEESLRIDRERAEKEASRRLLASGCIV